MNKFFKIRNKAFQSLILGLVFLTFYAYYRTTDNDIHPFTARFTNRSPIPELSDTSFNATAETNVSTAKNMSLETGSLPRGADSRRVPEDSVSVVASPPSGSAAPSSRSSSPISSANSQRAIGDNATKTIGNSAPSSSSSSASSSSSSSASSSSAPINNVAPSSSSTTGMPVRADSARSMYRSGHDATASDKCPKNGTGVDLAIAITSAPNHFAARTAIRQTWGHFDHRRDVAIVFVLGATNDRKLEKDLSVEENLYNDIVRGHFLDTYSNLTLKTISSLEWVSRYCADAKFMLKTDDDMFINVPRLLSFVKKHENEKNVIYGRLAKKWKPIRSSKSKYYVSTSLYKPAVFPNFTTGPAYLMSRDVVGRLYAAALDQTYLKLEDVFTTGIVAQKLGIKRLHATEFVNTRIQHTVCTVQRAISIHKVLFGEQFDLWKKLLDGKGKCK